MVDEEPIQSQPGEGQPAQDSPSGDETARLPPVADQAPTAADGTAVLPRADEAGDPSRWSARAGVPVRRSGEAAPQEQQWVPDQGPRVWWMPILIGLVILILLGLVSLGLWLALRGSTPAPAPTTAPSATSASPTPSSPPPTSASPPAVLVPIPPLANVPVDQATEILRSQGLVAKIVNRVSDSLPAGTVIDTDPAAGTQVPVGSQVTLFVATPPPTSASPPAPSPDGSGPP